MSLLELLLSSMKNKGRYVMQIKIRHCRLSSLVIIYLAWLVWNTLKVNTETHLCLFFTSEKVYIKPTFAESNSHFLD